ncbi:MAG: hypothetical protein P8X87_04015 [Candidatus Bathyarchaeota archaeon]|jgi:transposase-like protein
MLKANAKRKLVTAINVGGERQMKCPTCNLEMKVEEECGYMIKYKCDICKRTETLWTVCVTP